MAVRIPARRRLVHLRKPQGFGRHHLLVHELDQAASEFLRARGELEVHALYQCHRRNRMARRRTTSYRASAQLSRLGGRSPDVAPLPNDNSAHHEGLSAYRQAAALELCDVSKRYPGQPRDALKDLSLSVGAGEVCVLVGPSGSGKTTAMRLINRMIPLTSGDILLGGRSVLQREPNELRRDIGYVIQQIGLFPHLTVADNVATVPRLLGWDKDRIRARFEELIDLIGLDS